MLAIAQHLSAEEVASLVIIALGVIACGFSVYFVSKLNYVAAGVALVIGIILLLVGA